MVNIEEAGTFYEIWLKKRKLNKILPSLQQKYGIRGNFKVQNSYSKEGCTDLETKDIYLPLSYFDTDINSILMEHELLHHKVTKDILVRGNTKFARDNIQKVKLSINIVDDIIINRIIGAKKIKKVNRALMGLSKNKNKGINLNIFLSLTEKEKIKAIKECQQNGFFKEDLEPEEVVKTLEKVLLKKTNEEGEFRPIQEDDDFHTFVTYIGNFSAPDLIGDGPSDYICRDDSMDEELYEKAKKIFQNLICLTTQLVKREKWYGKRINRRAIELDDDTEPPFIQKKMYISRNRPNNILVILDLSGSMEGKPIERAKAFLLALFETNQEVVTIVGSCAKVNKVFLKSKKDIRNIFASDNDDFDKGWDSLGIENNSYNMIIVVTDLNIDRAEIEGLKIFIKRNKSRNTRVYILLVAENRGKMDEDDLERIKNSVEAMEGIANKIVDVSNTSDYVNFIKRLINIFS